jgi:hypothetical protein
VAPSQPTRSRDVLQKPKLFRDKNRLLLVMKDGVVYRDILTGATREAALATG